MRDSLPSPWFAAHLCDVLVHTGKLVDVSSSDLDINVDNQNGDVDDDTESISLRESCFLRYINRGPKLLIDMLKAFLYLMSGQQKSVYVFVRNAD